jgi:tetratricopeptide (TPR) repeat protein
VELLTLAHRVLSERPAVEDKTGPARPLVGLNRKPFSNFPKLLTPPCLQESEHSNDLAVVGTRDRRHRPASWDARVSPIHLRMKCNSVPRLSRLVWAIFLVALALPRVVSAQSASRGAVAEAQSLRDAGKFVAAVEILRAQLARNPSDGDAARLLAQTLYWLHDLDGAHGAYQDALKRHPEDTTLQFDYARMLVETNAWAAAETVLAPLQDREETRARATALLGTIAYWRGDWSGAKRLFTAALAANPDQPDIAANLRQIQLATSPWLRLSSSLRHDDQPLDRLGFGLETGWFATPLLYMTLRLEPSTFRLPDAASRRLWSAEAAIAGKFPRARLEVEGGGGVVRRDVSNTTEWRGRATMGIRLTPALTVRARAERAPYLHTLSSLDNPTTTDMVATHLGVDHRGWLGEAGMQVERFPDSNRITGQYGWLLAPIRRAGRAQLQGGYAFERRNSDESRFTVVPATPMFLLPDPRFMTRYVPYYTPLNLVSHSAAAALLVRAGSRVTLHVGGSYALHAAEDAPAFQIEAGSLHMVTSRREFSPWKADTSLAVSLGRGATLSFAGEGGRTAFYEWAAADVHLTYRFVSGASPVRR